MEQPIVNAPRPWEEHRARFMFALSILFLVLLAGLLHRHLRSEWKVLELQIQLVALLALWPIFLVEALWRFIERDRRESFWKHFSSLIKVLLFPPSRIGARSQAELKPIWLPVLGWREVDRELRRKLEKFFSVPMILIALLVLPLLTIELGWGEHIQDHKGLNLFLDIGNGVIWFAFATEFVIMVSVAKSKFVYAAQHWLDLAIILLPMVDFLPEFLPLLRALRLGGILRAEQLTRMGRLHRLRGLALKAWRAILLLEVIQRLTGQTLEKRRRKLCDLLAAKEEELEELRQEILDVEKGIAAQKSTEAVRDTPGERP